MKDDLNRKLMRELRARLTNLQLGLQYCTPLFREQGTPRHLEYLAMLNQNLYAMLRTISHLELTDGELPLFQPVTLDLASLCRKLGGELKGLADMAGVTFTCEVEEDSLLAEADEELLERGLLNLIANSIDAARQGSGHVCLRLRRTSDNAVFIVEDSGPGFPAQEAEPPSLLPRSGGLNLGLTVAERVAACHGGALLRLNLDSGAQVSLTIPIRPPGDTLLRSPNMGYESSGGFSLLLLELSTVLPASAFLPDELN